MVRLTLSSAYFVVFGYEKNTFSNLISEVNKPKSSIPASSVFKDIKL